MYKRIRRTIKANFPLHLLLLLVSLQDESECQTVSEDIDSTFLELYFRNNRLIDFQSKCLFDHSACDVIGRWVKPRLATALLGERCSHCTISQSNSLLSILTHLKKHRPDFYEKALITYLTNRQLLDLLTKQLLPAQVKPKPPEPFPTVAPPTPPLPPEPVEVLQTSASSIERRYATTPNVFENFIPGKPSSSYIDTSLIDIFILPRSSHSFSIPILTKRTF